MQYSVEDLVRLAKRDNNTVRPYLYVNPRQGKHIPSDPRETIEMCKALADRVSVAYPNDNLYVIGFAETATGIASVLSKYLDNAIFYQNTTREYSDTGKYLYFTETHSHAVDQMLRSAGIAKCLKKVDRILFIDDEVTTGNTICKLVEKIKENYDAENLRFGIVSILNSMTDVRIGELKRSGIECIYLTSIPFEYKKNSIWGVSVKEELHHIGRAVHSSVKYEEIIFTSSINPRNLVEFKKYEDENEMFVSVVQERLKGEHYKKAVVLGTEEIMYPAICTGNMMVNEGLADIVRVHATTRSPIIAYDANNYPLYCRYQLRSFYDEQRMTYVYNLEKGDIIIIISDAPDCSAGVNDLCEALRSIGNDHIIFAKWQYE